MEKDLIIEVLDLFKAKLKNNECTKEQTDAVYKAIVENMDIYATTDELSEHFGKSTEAVRGIIKRRMIEKPKRNISLYPFKAFRKIVPSSWLKKH